MAGEELLIADTADRDREGLRKLFDAGGYVCTACRDMGTARDLIDRKFFPCAVVDLDFESTNGGLELVRFIKRHSGPTQIVVLSGRRSYEAAVDALRLGVVDIVSKRPDQIQHLRSAVSLAIDRYRSGDKEGSLLREVRDVMEEGLKIMLQLARKVYGGGLDSSGGLSMKPAILLIDEDQQFLQQVAIQLQDRPWEVSIELSGGSGLDKASTFSFQIVAARNELIDLPGPMLIKSAQAQQAQTLGVVYSSAGAGSAQRYEGGHEGRTWPFTGAEDLVRVLDDLVGELTTLQEERRHMQAFRGEHGPFLKRYAELKVRIDSLSE